MVIKSIRFKFAVFIIFLLATIALSFSVLTVGTVKDYIVHDVINRAQAISGSAAASAAYSMISDDMLGMDSVVARVKASHPDIDFVAIADNSMKALVHSDIKKQGMTMSPVSGKLLRLDRYGYVIEGKAGNIEVITPVAFAKKGLGYVVLGMNRSLLYNASQSAKKSVLKGLAAALFLGMLGVFMLSASITKPIEELSAGVMDLKEGKKRTLKVYAKDELGRLTESFNEMSALIVEQKDRLAEYAGELEEAYISTLKVLAAAIDARDPYTLGHSARVAQYSMKMGEALGLPKKELEDLEIACLFHDVGKIKTPDHVLLKPGKLEADEFREMARHTEDGMAIISKAASLAKYIPAVRHHHEWYNGKGYPDGLAGDKIPLHAAIISIADSFDAMTSNRPYRNSRSEADALKEILRCSGDQFNPRLVNVFVKTFKNEHDGFMLSELI